MGVNGNFLPSDFDFFVRKQARNRAQGALGDRAPPLKYARRRVARDLPGAGANEQRCQKLNGCFLPLPDAHKYAKMFS
jgi:hypothetical protein